MAWTSSIAESEPWQEFEHKFNMSMEHSPTGTSPLEEYVKHWGYGVKLGSAFKRNRCAAPPTLEWAVRDLADNFKMGPSQTKVANIAEAVSVNTALETEPPLLEEEAPPAAVLAVSPIASLAKSPVSASPAFRSPEVGGGRVSLAEDPRTAGSAFLVAEGLAQATPPPPRGKSLFSALRRGYGAVAQAVGGAAGGFNRALDAAAPLGEAFREHVDRALEDERAAASAEKRARVLASAEKRARAPENRLPEPASVRRGLNMATPADTELARVVTNLPNKLTWATIRTQLAGSGVNASNAWEIYKSLGKHFPS